MSCCDIPQLLSDIFRAIGFRGVNYIRALQPNPGMGLLNWAGVFLKHETAANTCTHVNVSCRSLMRDLNPQSTDTP